MQSRISRFSKPLLATVVALPLFAAVQACATHVDREHPQFSGATIPVAPSPQRPVVAAAGPSTPSVVVPDAPSLLPSAQPQDARGISPLLAKQPVEFDPGSVPGTEEMPKIPGIGPATTAGTCPDPGMVLVEGEYCTDVQQNCVDWMEPPKPGGIGRCAKFAPSVCTGHRVHMKFCIDKDEYTAAGESLPMNESSYESASAVCAKEGKRLCKESEWNFACEGEEMLPYPTGYERASDKCNYDQMHLYDDRGAVKDLRKPSSSLTQCTSPFGVRNMTGNVDEWTTRDVTWGEYKNAMKGGWWMAARNRCRPATISHWDLYTDFQTGFRCCADGK